MRALVIFVTVSSVSPHLWILRAVRALQDVKLIDFFIHGVRQHASDVTVTAVIGAMRALVTKSHVTLALPLQLPSEQAPV